MPKGVHPGKRVACSAGNAAYHHETGWIEVPIPGKAGFTKVSWTSLVCICKPGRCFEYTLGRIEEEGGAERYLECHRGRFTVFGREIDPAFPKITYAQTLRSALDMMP